jgi:hypothetical protein
MGGGRARRLRDLEPVQGLIATSARGPAGGVSSACAVVRLRVCTHFRRPHLDLKTKVPPGACDRRRRYPPPNRDYWSRSLDSSIERARPLTDLPRAGVRTGLGPLNRQRKEANMRLTLVVVVALASLLAVTGVSSACPNGYVACGTNLCCPR